MRYLISTLPFVFLFASPIRAQQWPVIDWQKTLGGSAIDRVNSIQQTADGGYITAGWTNSNDGDVSGNHSAFTFDCWVVKIDGSGDLMWQKTLGGTGNDFAFSVQQTSDGGYIVAGYTESNNGDVSGNHGGDDFWVIKLDSFGNLIWQKALGGSADDRGRSVQQTSDGGYIVAGQSGSNDGDVSGNHGFDDFWVVKLNNLGNLIWQKTFGGSNADLANSVRQTTDGGYIVAGSSASNDGNVSGDHGGYDQWVVKLNSSGTLIWQKSLGGSGNDYAYSIRQTTDGGYIIAGSTYSVNGDVTGNHGGEDQWVVKLDGLGDLVWQKALGGSSQEKANAIQQTLDGGFIVAGWTYSNNGDVYGNNGNDDYWVAKLSSSGNLIWQRALGGSNGEVGTAILETDDGKFIMAGYTSSNDGDVSGNHGGHDFWIVKLNAQQVLLSAKVFLGGPYNSTTGLMSDALRTLGYVPFTSPYFSPPDPAPTTTASVLAVTGNNAIVDWIALEVRDPLDPGSPVARGYGLVQRDGDVVGPDGVSPVQINVPPGDYLVLVRHRVHLSTITSAPVYLSASVVNIDFTQTSTAVYGTEARKNVNGTMVLWPGDVNSDYTVRYTGTNNDRDAILTAVGGVTPTNTVPANQNLEMDINMDGTIRYTGTNNDRDIILQTIGGVTPTNTRVQQVPF